jgi:hypothetical protein
MKNLFLEDYAGGTEEEIRNHIAESYETDRQSLDKYDILIAYQSVGSWGCDSSAFLLLRDKETGELLENHGSHCSCYGFEGQFEPEQTTIEYLNSEHFSFICGGYDCNKDENRTAVNEYIKDLAAANGD